MAGDTGQGALEYGKVRTADAKGAAGMVGEGDHAIYIRKGRQPVGREVSGYLASYMSGAVYTGDDGDIVAGTGSPICSPVPEKGAALSLRYRERRPRICPGDARLGVAFEPKIVGMDVITG